MPLGAVVAYGERGVAGVSARRMVRARRRRRRGRPLSCRWAAPGPPTSRSTACRRRWPRQSGSAQRGPKVAADGRGVSEHGAGAPDMHACVPPCTPLAASAGARARAAPTLYLSRSEEVRTSRMANTQTCSSTLPMNEFCWSSRPTPAGGCSRGGRAGGRGSGWWAGVARRGRGGSDDSATRGAGGTPP